MLINLSAGSSEEESFLAIHPFGFPNFFISISSPNLSFKISLKFPSPSISPRSLDFFPVQNSPENNSVPEFLLSLFPLLSSTTSIKS